MKIVHICAALIFLTIYAVFHFGFRTDGAEQLYRINDELVFEVQPENENYNGLSIHGYRRTNKFVCFLCGEYERDDSAVWMTNVKYRNGDFVYTDFPQHEQAKTDIVNLRTGETVEANVPADFKFGDDLARLPEYQTRGLTKADEFKLTPDYIRANFQPLSSYTTRCAYINIFFAVAALFVVYPRLFLLLIDVLASANDPNETETNYDYTS